jgi:hypothetical protein
MAPRDLRGAGRAVRYGEPSLPIAFVTSLSEISHETRITCIFSEPTSQWKSAQKMAHRAAASETGSLRAAMALCSQALDLSEKPEISQATGGLLVCLRHPRLPAGRGTSRCNNKLSVNRRPKTTSNGRLLVC